MNILKINSGKVELRKDSGALIRTIGNRDAIQADINSEGFGFNNNSQRKS
jgi:hypothetical protein